MAGLAPPRDLTVAQWAEEERIVSSATSLQPGKWRNARVPYLVGVMDAFNDPRVRKVVMMTSARVGKTSLIENVAGYLMANDPTPMGIYFPSDGDAEDFSTSNLQPMIDETPELRRRFIRPVGNKGGSTTTQKLFPGGRIDLLSFNNRNHLRARTYRVVLIDEADEAQANLGGQGDPVALAEKRTATAQVGRKIGIFSTPTIAGESVIEKQFLEGDQRRFFVPCPHCGHHQTLRWGTDRVVWDRRIEADGRERWLPATARYLCEHCNEPWDDAQRIAAVAKGYWQATAPFDGIASFHINALYSSFTSLAEIVAEWRTRCRTEGGRIAFTNTTLGEPWRDVGDEPPKLEELLARREIFRAEVPTGAAVLTLGVDIGKNPGMLAYEVVGWGKDYESWSIAAGTIDHDPSTPEAWAELDAIRTKRWTREDGTTAVIEAVCIDSQGGHTDTVYAYAQERAGQRVYAIRGASDQPGTRSHVWPHSRATKGKGAGKVWLVGSQAAKDTALAALRRREPGWRYCHFPADRTAPWFEQLLAEVQVPVRRGNTIGTQWKPAGEHVRTEAADCRTYAYVALWALRATAPTLEKRLMAEEAARVAAQTVSRAGEGVEEVGAAAPQTRPAPGAPVPEGPALPPPAVSRAAPERRAPLPLHERLALARAAALEGSGPTQRPAPRGAPQGGRATRWVVR